MEMTFVPQNEDGKQIVPQKILAELYKPVSAVDGKARDLAPPIYPVEDTLSSYALGFLNGRYRGMHRVDIQIPHKSKPKR